MSRGSSPTDASSNPVVIIDFGAQYNQLIARRIREQHVFCEVVPARRAQERLAELHPAALVLSGGPMSVYDDGAPAVDPAWLDGRVPVLAICYGLQAVVHAEGGRVRSAGRREYGRAALTLGEPTHPLLLGLPRTSTVWMSHGDEVEHLPAGYRILASTPDCAPAVIARADGRVLGVQFHPEVRHTEAGRRLLENFLVRVARVPQDWTPAHFVPDTVARIQREVGAADAVVALSGGVDSAVAAALAQKALGSRLHAVMVDNGLLRAGEVEEVRAAFPDLDLTVVDAHDRFVSALSGVTDPEQKRRIVGREFIRVFEQAAEAYPGVECLIQGTVYPDVIESGGGGAATIKSHHNVGGLPSDVSLRLVEPLSLLFKDEVRLVGEALGLPASLVWRQPFPGPGLAVRILGEVTDERLRVLRTADAIVRAELSGDGWDREIWQAFAVLPGIRSVGVMGDHRTYGETVIVRAVSSDDGMTADWVRLPHDVLDRLATRLVGEVAEVNRVVYDITSKPPGTIEWE